MCGTLLSLFSFRCMSHNYPEPEQNTDKNVAMGAGSLPFCCRKEEMYQMARKYHEIKGLAEFTARMI